METPSSFLPQKTSLRRRITERLASCPPPIPWNIPSMQQANPLVWSRPDAPRAPLLDLTPFFCRTSVLYFADTTTLNDEQSNLCQAFQAFSSTIVVPPSSRGRLCFLFPQVPPNHSFFPYLPFYRKVSFSQYFPQSYTPGCGFGRRHPKRYVTLPLR